MKKTKLPLIVALMLAAVGGAFAKKAHRELQGNLLICVGGVCEISYYSDNDEEGGIEEEPQVQFYKGNVSFPCNTSACSQTYPPQVWFHE